MSEKETKPNALDEKTKNEMNEAFSLFDKDSNGTISSNEIGIVMKALGENPTEDQIANSLSEMETTEDGSLAYEEYERIMTTKRIGDEAYEENVLEAFKFFDKEGTGKLKVETMKELLTTMCEKLNEKEFEEFLKDADPNGEGLIHYETYVKKLMMLE
jgi:calmodulin